MVFCNNKKENGLTKVKLVTILILIDGFLQYYKNIDDDAFNNVTILILIDGFLQ